MTNENNKDSSALGDDKTVMVHKGLCMYLDYLSKKEGKKVELIVRGLTTATPEEIESYKEYRKKYGINM